MKSEFGMGLGYCLGLFLAHERQILTSLATYRKICNESMAYSMWFYAAADHLFDLRVGDAPKHLKSRFEKFRAKCLSLRLPLNEQKEATEKDFYWAIQEAKDLLRLLDKANGVKTCKGDWE